MSTLEQNINIALGSIAEAVRAKISYEMEMKIDVKSFFALKFQKERIEETKLNYNLYKNYR